MNRMLQACTPEGESGAVKKLVRVHIYKCADCATERKVLDHAEAPMFCSWCGGLNVGFMRSEDGAKRTDV